MTCRTMVGSWLQLREVGCRVVEMPCDEQAYVKDYDTYGEVCEFLFVHSVILFIAFNKKRML